MPTMATNAQDKVRELQVKLYLAAKRSSNRRFHALWDKVHRRDVLERAWRKVSENRGAPGIDGITIAQIEEEGVEGFLAKLEAELRAERYRPQPVLRVRIPKPGRSETRPLGIPTVTDRVVQQAVRLVMEPIFEADFHPRSFGFRPKRSTHMALDAIKDEAMDRKRRWVVDADIRGFFDSLDHEILMQRVALRISDRRLLKLLRSWLRAGVFEGGSLIDPETGTPQGGVISPLLANVYLNALDWAWEERHGELGVLVRYADDLVVLAHGRPRAAEALQALRALLAELGLELSASKTRIVSIDFQGLDFLGFHQRMVRGFRRRNIRYLARWPSAHAVKAARARIRELTGHERLGDPLAEIVADLNLFLKGWGAYYRRGSSTVQFRKIDSHAIDRLARIVALKFGKQPPLRYGRALLSKWDYLGLHRLVGTVEVAGVYVAR